MEKIIRAFNTLVFKKPRPLRSIRTIADLSAEVQKDFLEALQELFVLNGQGENYLQEYAAAYNMEMAEDIISIKHAEKFNQELLVSAYLHLMSSEPDFLNGLGFTPLLAVHSDETIRGLNCLGKAIVLGILIKNLGHIVKLAICSDHAGIIVCTENEDYLADPNALELKQLHGSYQKHDAYEWYTVHPQDEIEYAYLAIHDFDHGILNAIVEHFIFLKAVTPEVIVDGEIPIHEQATLRLKEPQYSFLSCIESVDWFHFQQRYFQGMHGYRFDHEIEFLIEYERIQKTRILIRNQTKAIDDVTLIAYEKATGKKFDLHEFKVFQEAYKHELFTAYQKIAALFRHNKKGTQIMMELPKIVADYMGVFFEEIKKNQFAKDYLLKKTPPIDIDILEFA